MGVGVTAVQLAGLEDQVGQLKEQIKLYEAQAAQDTGRIAALLVQLEESEETEGKLVEMLSVLNEEMTAEQDARKQMNLQLGNAETVKKQMADMAERMEKLKAKHEASLTALKKQEEVLATTRFHCGERACLLLVIDVVVVVVCSIPTS